MAIGKNTNVIDSTVSVGTPMVGWQIIRAAASEDAAAASDFSSGWGFTDQTANLIDLQGLFKSTGAQYQLAFYSAPFADGDAASEDPANDDTASIELIGYANNSIDSSVNPPILIAQLAGIVGTMPVEGVINGLWLDSLDDSAPEFEGDVEVFDTANNRVARALVDIVGIRYLYGYVYGALGAQAGEAPSIAMVGRVY